MGYIGKKSNAELYDKTANITGKFTKYAKELWDAKYYNGNKNGFAWCCVFVDWLFFTCAGHNKEVADSVKPYSIYGAGVSWVKRAYQNVNRITKTPVPGAQIFFLDKSGELAHTGIVTEVTSTEVKTIEGNTSNMVKEKVYKLNDATIDCYGLPFYDEGPDPEPVWETILEFKDIDGNPVRVQVSK